MPSAFLSHDARVRDNWKTAFPDLIASTLARVSPAATLVWVLRPTAPGTDITVLLTGLRRQAADRPLIVLADVPDYETVTAACNLFRVTPVGDGTYKLWKYMRVEARTGRELVFPD